MMPCFPPRSGYDEVGGVVMFGRTVDKIRLQQSGNLPAEYNLGHGLDGRHCRFLHVEYAGLCARVRQGGSDDELLQWCFCNGRKPEQEEILLFIAFMAKRGWRDDTSDWIREQKQRLGCLDREDIQTCFDIHDVDEGRK